MYSYSYSEYCNKFHLTFGSTTAVFVFYFRFIFHCILHMNSDQNCIGEN